MEALFQRTYSTCVKSLVANVEQFLVDIDRNDLSITDETMIDSLRTMSKTLQRILSKCDKNKMPSSKEQMQNNASNSSGTKDRCTKESKPPVLDSLIHESFLYNGPQDGAELINSPEKDVDSTRANEIVADRIRKRMKKDIDESDEEINCPRTIPDGILSPLKAISVKSSELNDGEDSSIVKHHNDTYECTVCNKTMNKNNVESHRNGKSHKTKSRDNSCVDQRAALKKIEDKVALVLEMIKEEFTQSESGEKYITVRNSGSSLLYYCNLCEVKIPVSDQNLLLHVQGQPHRKCCQI